MRLVGTGASLVLVVSVALAASAATQPRVLRYACASDARGAKQVLRYVARASECRGARKTLVRFAPRYPVYVCRAKRSGQLRLVSARGACESKETLVALPGARRAWFCVARKGRALRAVRRRPGCRRGEFAATLPKRRATPRAPVANHAPVAGSDAAATDERTAKVVAVLANDTDAERSPLRVASVDAGGTTGSPRLEPDGTVTYDPSGRFAWLKAGQTATDTFRYRVSDGAAESAPALVTVTVSGVNERPAAVADTAVTGEGQATRIAVLGNDGDGDGDPLSVASLDRTGTRGSATIAGDGSVTYDPGSKFDSLEAGESAHDSFRYRASDGRLDSGATTVDVTIEGRSEAPVVTTSTGSTAYTQGAPAVVVDGAATVTDADSAELASARASLSSGFQAGDELQFTAQSGISGSYDSSTGVLTLAGSASKASYQAALRSVRFRSTNAAPSAAKTVELTVSDGAAGSAPATKGLVVTRVNGPPAVATSSGAASYSEGGAAVAPDPAVTVSSATAQLQGATVSITGGFSAADGDKLALASQNGISGTYNSGTGVLTLTGNASVASYQAALRAVAFSLTGDDPSTATRTVTFRVTDTAGAASAVAGATRNVEVSATDDAPAIATSGGHASYTEGASPVQVDPAATVADTDSAQLGGATASITANFRPADGDRLAFANQSGISGSYNATTGVLTLTGNASLAGYQAALRSVAFSLTDDTPSTATRTVSFRVTDSSGAASNVAARDVTVTAVDPPADPLDAAIEHDLAFAGTQLTRTLSETPAGAYPQETGSDGRWENYSPGWWTSGFFPGNLWLMYEATGETSWRTAAQTRQAGLESQKTRTDTHDLGFMLFDSFGQGYRLTGTTSYRDVALQAARSLATRYSPVVHSIRSWDNPSGAAASDFRVIVDNMMNLELLFWAADHGGDPGLHEIARQHALRTAAEHVRADGSTNHLVVYDSNTGAVKRKETVQGYSNSSTWSRGQAWAVYGFTMAYRETGDAQMLATARKVADYWVDHLPADGVPYWDFQAPGIPSEPRDSSAAAIAASGLIELSRLETDSSRGERYLGSARETLTSLSSPAYLAEGTSSRSVLLHGTSNKPGGHYDRGLIYGDYFFIEALLRYRTLP